MRIIFSPYLVLLFFITVCPVYAISAETAVDSIRQKTITDDQQHDVRVNLRREFVYGLTLFDGAKYQGTFSPGEIATIYMIAGVDNVISSRKTDVYYWPLTKEYRADWMETNEEIDGSLEVLRNGKTLKTLDIQEYTYVYDGGYAGDAKTLLVGQDASERVAAYQAEVEAYYHAILDYYQMYSEYNKRLQDYIRRGEKGQRPIPPAKPDPPADYVQNISRGFILNLPPGNYRIRMRGTDGRIIAGSERKVVAFSVLDRGIGYKIFPHEKWTSVTNSDDLGSILFIAGSRVLYLQPFQTARFNMHHHTRLTQLPAPAAGRGLENQLIWVYTEPVHAVDTYLELLVDGQVLERVKVMPYYVQQHPGYTLGYEISELALEQIPEQTPSFMAYKLSIPDTQGHLQLRLVDGQGKVVAGSLRSIRVIKQPGPVPLILIALIPMAAGIGILSWRARWTRNKRNR